MADMFDTLPTAPKTKALDGFITVENIKAKISAKLYDELTEGDDTVTAGCIAAAIVQEETLLSLVQKKLIPDLPLHREVGRLLTIYQMYVYNGDEEGGREYLVQASDLISTKYGNLDDAKKKLTPAGAVKKPRRKSWP